MPGPNLLLILADQLQRDRLSPWSGPIAMPALQRLADDGLRCSRAYAACPLCVPTRPSIQTGLYPHTHGATSFGDQHFRVRKDTPLLVDDLAAAGYRVGYDGLWHVRRHLADTARDAACFAWLREQHFPYHDHTALYEAQGGAPGSSRSKVTTPSDSGTRTWGFSLPRPAIWTRPIEDHPERQLARRAAASLISAFDGQPVAQCCSFAAPHPPLLPPAEFWDSTPDSPPPANAQPPGDTAPDAVRNAPGAQAVRDWTEADWRPARRGYDAYTRFLDSNVDILLRALDQSGRRDDTVVVFLADHGECLGAHGLYQKGVPYEESAGVPLLLSGPGVPSGRLAAPVSQVDLAPTLRALLGLPDRPAHGLDLLGPLQRDAVGVTFDGYIDGGWHWRAMVSETWKYARFCDGGEQLFDLLADPLERVDLARSPTHRELLLAARARLAQWQRETDDQLILPVAAP